MTGTRKRIAAPEIKARTPSAAHHAERHTLSPSDHILAGLPVRPKRRDQESRRGQSAGSAEGQGHLDALLGGRGLPSARHRDGAAGGARPPAPCLLRGTRVVVMGGFVLPEHIFSKWALSTVFDHKRLTGWLSLIG